VNDDLKEMMKNILWRYWTKLTKFKEDSIWELIEKKK